jgi:serine/threonine-protein kinase RsbW
MTIDLINKLSELDRLNDAIESFCSTNQIPDAIAFKVNLAIEEIVTNIIKYGYEGSEDGNIHIDLQKNVNSIFIQVADSAKEFDPLQREDPDTTLSLNERKIGGLGIFFAKELMDTMDYDRKADRNILTMTKSLGDN